MRSAFNIPAGYALVPLEPTREMLDAYCNQDGKFQSARSDWRAMLAAAPTPPVDALPGEPVAPMEWTARRSVDGLRIIIDSADFEHDASLILTGDFATEGEKLSFAGAIADKLNSLAASVASRAGSEPVAIPERNALLRLLVAEVTRLQTLFTDALGDTQQDSAPIAPAASAQALGEAGEVKP